MDVFATYTDARARLRPGDMVLALAPSGFVVVPIAKPVHVASQQLGNRRSLGHDNVIKYIRPVERIMWTRRAG